MSMNYVLLTFTCLNILPCSNYDENLYNNTLYTFHHFQSLVRIPTLLLIKDICKLAAYDKEIMFAKELH